MAYAEEEKALWEVQERPRKDDGTWPWAKAVAPGKHLESASVSIFSRRYTSDPSVIVGLVAGTDYMSESITVSLHARTCDGSFSRLVSTVEGFAGLDESVRVWVLDRLGAVNLVVEEVLACQLACVPIRTEEECKGVRND